MTRTRTTTRTKRRLMSREEQASDWSLADGRWANFGTGVIQRRWTILPLPWGEYVFRVCAKTSAGQQAYFKQNDPHPDLLPSDGRGNSQTRLLSTARCALFSLPGGEGQGEGKQRELPPRVSDHSRNCRTGRVLRQCQSFCLACGGRWVCSYTDFQSAVSPPCSRQCVGSVPRVGVSQRLAECNSAIQRDIAQRGGAATKSSSSSFSSSASTARFTITRTTTRRRESRGLRRFGQILIECKSALLWGAKQIRRRREVQGLQTAID